MTGGSKIVGIRPEHNVDGKPKKGVEATPVDAPRYETDIEEEVESASSIWPRVLLGLAILAATGWIGASDATTEGTWQWVTGPEAGTTFSIGNDFPITQIGEYANWNPGEPNDFCSFDAVSRRERGKSNADTKKFFQCGHIPVRILSLTEWYVKSICRVTMRSNKIPIDFCTIIGPAT